VHTVMPMVNSSVSPTMLIGLQARGVRDGRSILIHMLHPSLLKHIVQAYINKL